ncbi:divalent metal cation transporter [Georgenia ruanii]|uniref:Divalent metal cation transporter n=1 Tax=Georgenia ruanii TaxID=348442 RepID=A0A7J9V330_9MICO|nr:divalent metal cation transporter [Georgenia ruanii]
MTDTRASPRQRWGRRGALALLAALGPGLIAANAGNDAGGIATYASAGSQFGYRTLFVMVLVTVALVVVQEMSARLGAYTGEGLVSLFREHFPLRAGAFAVFMLLVANVGLVVSEFAGIGAAFELLHVNRYVSVPIAAAIIWAVVVFGSYRYAERVFLVLTLAFLAYPLAMFLGHPNWGAAGLNLVVPHLLGSKAFLFLAVALIGTTITPYMQLYQAAAVADRGIGPEDYPAERADTIFGSIFCNLISITIIVATAAAIGGTGPLDSAAQAAQALRPVAGSAATQLFAVGLLGASALAAAVVPLSTAYAVAEAVGVERSVSRSFREAPLFLGLFTSLVAVGATIALAPGNLISLLINTQVLNGLITPIILTFILLLANRRSVLGDAANGTRLKVLATTCVIAVAVLAAIVLVQTVLNWFGVG